MIERWKLWFTDNKKEVILFIAIALVSLFSFALGYLAAGENQVAPIIIQKQM